MPKIVRFHETGAADVLKLEDLAATEPKEGEVRIRVEAIGLNRAEVMFREGKYLQQPVLPSRLGYEAAGVIEAVGPGVTEFHVGEHVSTVPAFLMGHYGTYGESALVPAAAVARYPANLSAIQATSVWMQYLTAWGGLIHHGHLQAGQAVLITAASSSVGLAAIELAKIAGATAIASTRTSAKKQALLDFGATAVIASDEEDLAARVHEITNGRGADLIFDPIAGPFLETLASAAAQGAQIIEYGALATGETPYPLFQALSKALVVRGYTLFEINSDPVLRATAQTYIYDLLAEGKLNPKIDKTFPLDEIVAAHRYMESNQQFGKIVVTV
jgi:NADPH:quinone reductase-like Zn-dependent oxidoreductase